MLILSNEYDDDENETVTIVMQVYSKKTQV